MPLFMSDEELAGLSNDAATLVAEKADAYIREVYVELETVKARADAAAITAEQTCSLLEQKFLSLSQEFSNLESQNAQLQSSLEDHLAELAQARSHKHQLHIESIGKDGERERLTTELAELHKSKRQLIELLEQKDLEISEKNTTIKSYLDKIVNLTDSGAQKEARVSETEAELARAHAASSRLSQEKELIERHNAWLNEELTAKVDSLIELRRTHANLEADMSAKLADVEKKFNDCSTSLNWHKERLRELEMKLTSLQEELCSSKDAAAAIEEQYSAELSTANKLVDLYRENSEEWSRKAGELEGVVKALETHLSQVENDYKERLEKEVSTRKQFQKEAADLMEKLEKCEAEIENIRKANELNLLPLSSFTPKLVEENQLLIPKIPVGVSGTALAASLLRDGWSLAKMYEKYQEAVDALRHEQLGRKESESILQRVLCELEEKAGVIQDERAEYERMVEAYSLINQKLQNSISEQSSLEKTILELKADLRRHERESSLAKKEIIDLEKQVTVLLKECRDIQLRCGAAGHDDTDDSLIVADIEMNVESDTDKIISEHLLTFKDISGLVEQNVKLRSLVRSLSNQIEHAEMEVKEKLERDLKKKTDEAASRVAAVLERAEEQERMIESLHTSVGMYKRLYEEEHKLHSSYSHPAVAAPGLDNGKKDLVLLLEGSQEATKKAQEKVAERTKCLEEDLAKSRSEIITLRSERDKLALETNFAREKLDSITKEAEHQRRETNCVIARNVEFSQLIVDYQRRLRESSESLDAAEERSRKLSMEVSVLKHEKELLSNAEKRACEEVRSLSERFYRLQATLETIQSAEEVREEARAAERRKKEEYIKHLEREWAEAKKELQEERNNVRNLSSDREQTLKSAMKQVEEMGKELANALRTVAAAESRASISEAKLSGLEKKMKTSDAKDVELDDRSGQESLLTNEVGSELRVAKEELKKLTEEAQANKNHMLQYKSIAQVNEAALKQMELAHENFKAEAEKLQKSLEAELLSLRDRVSELENESSLKSVEVASATAGKEEALASALAEIRSLKEETLAKTSQIEVMEIQISALKDDLAKEHERWRAAQANYERQVILQSETIQELTKTSQALASLQEEASELRKMADLYKSENSELKAKWEVEKSMLEESKSESEKKYDEINEQNKILHSRLEALHIQLAEKDCSSAGISSSGSSGLDPLGDSGLQNVVNYLRRRKEIAETEISLLKQEKLRLQSQLENALKAAESAQASLNAERANARASLLSEEEIKSLKLQVREMNLLRESNIQLREENKHNFEECQKLREVAQKIRMEFETLENLLRERQIEVESCKKEIEMQRMEKELLEKRVSELLERLRNIDVEDYHRLKAEVRQMEEKIVEKDTQIAEMRSLLSKKQDAISQLEQDLANNKLELNERENRLNEAQQVQANLKSDMEKQKKLMVQFKRRLEILSKEKEEMSKENQALSKQLEDLKQGKRSAADTTGEQVTKEKEEKEHRIQILEKTVERQRDELKKREDEMKRREDDYNKEKAARCSTEKAIMDSLTKLAQEKTNILSELDKHRPAVKCLADELEKLKHAEGNLPEGTSVVQILAGTILDDRAAAYMSAVETFERVAHSVSIDLGSGSRPADTAPVADASVGTTTAVPAQATPIASSVAPTTNLPTKAVEDRERRLILSKTNSETRKAGRRLVRPHLAKHEEPQGDVEMSEVEGSTNSGKHASSQDTESPENVSLPTQSPLRKRTASSSPSELHQESMITGEMGSEVASPALKRSKGSDSQPEGSDGQPVSTMENIVTQPAVDESLDATGDPQVSGEDAIDAEKDDVETTGEKSEDPKESQELDGSNEAELQDDKNEAGEEILDKSTGTELLDEESKDPAEQENQQLDFESEREEGELITDADLEGGVSHMIGSPEIGEGQSEPAGALAASPARVDDINVVTAPAESEAAPDVLNDEKSDGDRAEEVASTASASSLEPDVSKQAGPAVTTEAEETKHASPVGNPSTLVNLSERAKERSAIRQAGARALTPTVGRGRGRAVVRGRGVRGGRTGRGGRGQSSGQQ